jgi:O-antigen ligase
VLYPGLLLFALSLPLSKSASNVLLGVLYLLAIAGALYSKEFRDDIIGNCRQPLTAAFALFSLIAYIGIIHTEKYADGFRVANKFVSLPAIYFLVSVLLQSDRSIEAGTRRAESLLLFFLAGLAALNLLGALIYLGVVGGAAFVLPLAPLGMHHIWYSNLNALGVYTAAALLLFTRHGTSARGRALLGCFLLLSTLGIVLSMSRTAWFGIALTAAIMAAAIRSKKTIVLVLLLSVLTLASLYRFVPLVQERVNLIGSDISRYSADKNAISSIGGRFVIWEAAFLMFKKHPFIGVGTGDFERTMRFMRNAKRLPTFVMGMNQPHNIYLFPMATNGIVGLTALLFIFYRSLQSAVPMMRAGGAGKLFAFLAMATAVHFMIAGFMDSFFNIQILRYAFAFIMGVCIRGSMNRAPRP